MLTSKFSNIISKSPADFGHINLMEMDLHTKGPPVSSKLYSIPLKYQSFIDEEIWLLEDAVCISKSLNIWASPISIIKKKSDTSQPHKIQLCMCIDYRKVNQCLVTACNSNNGKVVFTSPFQKFRNYSVVSINVSISDLLICILVITILASQKKIAFVTAVAKYQWNVVPFGLATAVSTFQYLMSKVLTGLSHLLSHIWMTY